MSRNSTRQDSRIARHARVRRKVVVIVGRPRLSVFRSLKQIYGQLIDDTSGRTKASLGTFFRRSSTQLSTTPQGRICCSIILKRAVSRSMFIILGNHIGGAQFSMRASAVRIRFTFPLVGCDSKPAAFIEF